MDEKQTSEKFARLKKALEDAKEILGVEDVNEDDEMKHAKICTELDALADELEQIEHKAEMLVRKVLFNELDTDGAARICYASAFSAFLTLSGVRAQLQNAVDFIRKQSQRDER